MRERAASLLESLCLTPGVSGFEDPIRRRIAEAARELGIEAEAKVDKLGNLILSMGPEDAPSIALFAHMDEVGIVVRHIEERGILRIEAVGGLDPRVLIGSAVVIYGRGERRVYGVVGVKPVHLAPEEERRKVPDMKSLYVDIGVPSREEASKLVMVGDVGHIVKEFRRLPDAGGEMISCGSLDDRSGCAALLLAASMLDPGELRCRLHLVFTVQEEVGARGSRVAAYNLQPDVAIAVDVTHAVGYPELQPKDFAEILVGKGPVIEIGPPISWRLARWLIELAAEAGIPHQVGYLRGRSGTDIDEAQIARSGSIAAVVSIPLKYMHTPVELASLADIEATARLLAELIKRFDREALEKLKPT